MLLYFGSYGPDKLFVMHRRRVRQGDSSTITQPPEHRLWRYNKWNRVTLLVNCTSAYSDISVSEV